MNKIVELLIDWDNNEYEDLGVDILSLVSQPAIGYQWQAFSQEEEVNHQDFAVELFEKCGESFGMEDVFVELKDFEFLSISDIAKGITSLDILGKRNADEEGITKYVYTGPISSNSRNFCKAMIRMNKLYSAEELEEVGVVMKREFPSLYPDSVSLVNGQLSGGVAQWLGGSNCNHYWNEVEVFSEGNGPKVVVSKGRANSNGVEGESMSSRFGSQAFNQTWKFNDDQMIITGPAMVPSLLIPRRDSEGNTFHVFFSPETVKDIAQKFVAENKQNNTDINHDDNVVQENTLLESWIVEDNKMDKSTALGFDVPAGSWMVSMKINNEETWSKIKSGELTGFSVAGDFAEKLSK